MGKLNIAHHKSYHPYRADNIEKVRRDEEEARLKEAQEDGRVMLADSEARISLLRERAKADAKPSKHKQQREEERLLQAGNPLIAGPSSPSAFASKEKGIDGALTLTASSGHVNFFEELEHSYQSKPEHNPRPQTKADVDKAREKELERGVPLMPEAKDRNPWYMNKGLKHPKDMTDEEIKSKEPGETDTEKEKWGRRSRGNKVSSKTALDPLKDVQSHLAARTRALSSRTGTMPPPPPPGPSRNPNPSPPKDAASERTTREAAERARAQALITRRRAAQEASSSVGGDTPLSVRDGGYSDGYNKQETQAAHQAWERQRGRYGDRRWDDDVEDRERERNRSQRSELSRSHRSSSRESQRHHEGREGGSERDRHRDMPRSDRNRTRGVEDVRRRS